MLSKTILNAVYFATLIFLCGCGEKRMLSTPTKAKYFDTRAINDTLSEYKALYTPVCTSLFLGDNWDFFWDEREIMDVRTKERWYELDSIIENPIKTNFKFCAQLSDKEKIKMIRELVYLQAVSNDTCYQLQFSYSFEDVPHKHQWVEQPTPIAKRVQAFHYVNAIYWGDYLPNARLLSANPVDTLITAQMLKYYQRFADTLAQIGNINAAHRKKLSPFNNMPPEYQHYWLEKDTFVDWQPSLKYELTMGAIADTVLCQLSVGADNSNTYELHNLDNHQQQYIKSDDRIWLRVGAYQIISAQNDTINFDLDKSGGVYSLYLYHSL
jgi:hypothetical protein